MRTLLGWALLALFAVGFGGAILRERWFRLAGCIVMLAVGAGALGMAIGPAAGLWIVGPLAAVLRQGPGPARRRLVFDPLVRRAAVIGALAMGASLAALQYPIDDVPRPVALILWNLAALGVGWVMTALDAAEIIMGAVLAIAGGSALLVLGGSSTGWLTVAAASALAAIPGFLRVADRRIPGMPAVVAAAAALTLLILMFGAPSGVSLADLSLTLRAPALLGVVVLLIGLWTLQGDARVLVAIPASLMLITVSPALSWAGLAASLTLLLGSPARQLGTSPSPGPPHGGRENHQGQKSFGMAWAGLALLASTTVVAATLDPLPRLRLTTAALAGGWVLLVGGRRVSALVASTASLFLAVEILRLPAAAGGRFQLVAAITAAFLFATTLVEPEEMRPRLSLALILVALATLTPVGTLAAILLVVDILVMEATAPPEAGSRWRTLVTLARSGWPPTVAFAGRTLVALAAIETGPLLGLVALGLVLTLLLAPLFAPAPAAVHAGSRLRGVVLATLSLATGLVPGWVARLGHL